MRDNPKYMALVAINGIKLGVKMGFRLKEWGADLDDATEKVIRRFCEKENAEGKREKLTNDIYDKVFQEVRNYLIKVYYK